LTALEAARNDILSEEQCMAARVCEKMRAPIAKLAGVAGFRPLITRAVALAKSDAASLDVIEVRSDGSLAGFEAFDSQAEAGIVVVARLLELLVTFIGISITLQILRDVWPDATLDTSGAESGEQS
jgi:hypothetical protein